MEELAKIKKELSETELKLQSTSVALNRETLLLEDVTKKRKDAEKEFSVLIERFSNELKTIKEDIASLSHTLEVKTSTFESDALKIESDRNARKISAQQEINELNNSVGRVQAHVNEKIKEIRDTLELTKQDHLTKIGLMSKEHSDLVHRIDSLTEKSLTLSVLNTDLEMEKIEIEKRISDANTFLYQLEEKIKIATKNATEATQQMETAKHDRDVIILDLAEKNGELEKINLQLPVMRDKHADIVASIDRDTPAYQSFVADKTALAVQTDALRKKEIFIKNKYKQIGITYE